MKLRLSDDQLLTLAQQELFTCSVGDVMDKPFGLMLEGLDDLVRKDVYVNTGSSPRNALWGELMSIRARKLGARGAILNGYSRDAKAMLRMAIPSFSWDRFGRDSAPRYKVVDYRVPVEIGSVQVRPGDICFGDIDGVCLVPAEAAESSRLSKVRLEQA